VSVLLSILFALAPLSFAQEETPLDLAIARAGSHASADFTGNGSTMKLTYTSKQPLHISVLLLKSDGSFVASETLAQVLDAGETKSAIIPLASSRGWRPGEAVYRLHILAEKGDEPRLLAVEFQKTGLMEYPKIAASQFLRAPEFTPSVYHRIPSRHVLGVSITTLAGLLLIFIACINRMRKGSIAAVTVATTLLLSTMTSIDVLRYSTAHLRSWFSRDTYGSAGSLYAAAEIIRSDNATGVLLCTDDTSYPEVILQYALYPIRVSDEKLSHIVVHRSVHSSFKENVVQCNDKHYPSSLVREFPDGTKIFRTTPSAS